jgi:hypothetical protein
MKINNTSILISRSVLVRMRNVSYKICRENRNTHFIFSSVCFSKIIPFYETMWEYFRDWQITDVNMAHAHCMLDTQGCKHAWNM